MRYSNRFPKTIRTLNVACDFYNFTIINSCNTLLDQFKTCKRKKLKHSNVKSLTLN